MAKQKSDLEGQQRDRQVAKAYLQMMPELANMVAKLEDMKETAALWTRTTGDSGQAEDRLMLAAMAVGSALAAVVTFWDEYKKEAGDAR